MRSALDECSGDWDHLVEAMPLPSPFLRSWWLAAQPNSEFLLVYRGDELLGGLPLSVGSSRGIPRYWLLGSGPLWPHGFDVVAHPAERDTVAQVVVDRLCRRSAVVDLVGCVPEGALVEGAPPHARAEVTDEYATIDLPSSYEGYLGSLHRHLRQEIRRIERRLVERGATYHAQTGVAAVNEGLRNFERLHLSRWQDQSGIADTFEPLRGACRAGAALGEVFFHEVRTGDRVLATLLTLEVRGYCLFYQMGRDPDPSWSGTGMFLEASAVRRCCELGYHTVDLGTGGPERKVEWGAQRHPLVEIRWGTGAGRVVLAWRRVRDAFRATAHAAAEGR